MNNNIVKEKHRPTTKIHETSNIHNNHLGLGAVGVVVDVALAGTAAVVEAAVAATVLKG